MTQYNLGRVTPIFQGDYNPEVSYECLDVVLYQGSSYVAKTDTLGNDPTNPNFWQMVASVGAIGSVTMDSELSTTSENPVTNKAITLKINDLESLIIPEETIRQIVEGYQYQNQSQVEQAIVSKGYQNADQVEQAIVSKGYQNQSQVEQAITSKGYQTKPEVENIITGKGYQNADQVEQAITGKGYQNQEQVEQAIVSKGYQNAEQVETAIVSKKYQTSDQVEQAVTSKGYQTDAQVKATLTANPDGYAKKTEIATINNQSITEGGNIEIKSGGLEVVTIDKVVTKQELIDAPWDGYDFVLPNIEANKYYKVNLSYPINNESGSPMSRKINIKYNGLKEGNSIIEINQTKTEAGQSEITTRFWCINSTEGIKFYNCKSSSNLQKVYSTNEPYTDIFNLNQGVVARIPADIYSLKNIDEFQSDLNSQIRQVDWKIDDKANYRYIQSKTGQTLDFSQALTTIPYFTEPITQSEQSIDYSSIENIPTFFTIRFIFTAGEGLTSIKFTDSNWNMFTMNTTPGTQYLAEIYLVSNFYTSNNLIPLNGGGSGSSLTPEQVQEIINTNTAGFQTDANVKATIKTNPEGFAKSSEIPTDNATLTNGAGYQTDAQVKATLTANPDGYAKKNEIATINGQVITNGGNVEISTPIKPVQWEDIQPTISGKNIMVNALKKEPGYYTIKLPTSLGEFTDMNLLVNSPNNIVYRITIPTSQTLKYITFSGLLGHNRLYPGNTYIIAVRGNEKYIENQVSLKTINNQNLYGRGNISIESGATPEQVQAIIDQNTAGFAKTTDVDTKLSKKADTTRVDEVSASIPTNTEVWSFTMEDGSVVSKNVYIDIA